MIKNENDIQSNIFNKISDQLPGHLSLVDEISSLLNISTDSAYRRIRGEKPISVHELQQLCQHYQFSFDDLINVSANGFTFRSNLLDEQNFSFSRFLEKMLENFEFFDQFENPEIIFILNELNILQLMQVPELISFKLFFWQKSNLGFPAYKDKLFSIDDLDDKTILLSKKIYALYSKIKTIELTTEENLNSFLKQIKFYNEAGYFKSKEDAIKLAAKLTDFINHLKEQAELSFKFEIGTSPQGKEGNFNLYYNDIILTDNTILVKAGTNEISFITNNAINLLHTYSKKFYIYNHEWFNNLKQKSSLISGIAEKDRSKFFNKLCNKIEETMKLIEA